MKVFVTWNELMELEEKLEKNIFSELKRYFIELMTEMLDEEDFESYDVSEVGKISVLESGDELAHLPDIGMTEETMTVLESIPEYVEPVRLSSGLWYRVVIIFGDSGGVVIYVPDEMVTGDFEIWINEWKEEEHG